MNKVFALDETKFEGGETEKKQLKEGEGSAKVKKDVDKPPVLTPE